MSQVTLKYVDGEGTEVVTPLAEARATLIADGLPVRSFGSYAGMHHYPGWWWSATTMSLLPYESLLERDRLLAADFDRDVVAIASQPFGLTTRAGGANRRHVPGGKYYGDLRAWLKLSHALDTRLDDLMGPVWGSSHPPP